MRTQATLPTSISLRRVRLAARPDWSCHTAYVETIVISLSFAFLQASRATRPLLLEPGGDRGLGLGTESEERAQLSHLCACRQFRGHRSRRGRVLGRPEWGREEGRVGTGTRMLHTCVVRKAQVKTTARRQYTPTGAATICTLTRASTGEDTAQGALARCRQDLQQLQPWEDSWADSYKTNDAPATRPSSSAPWYLPKGVKHPVQAGTCTQMFMQLRSEAPGLGSDRHALQPVSGCRSRVHPDNRVLFNAKKKEAIAPGKATEEMSNDDPPEKPV